MFKFLIFLISFLPLLIFGDPQNCNKLFVSRYYEYYSIGNLTVTANLELVKNLNSTTIFVTNVTVDGNVNLGTPDSVCVNVDESQNFPTPEFCSTSLNSPFNFTTSKPSFDLQIHFSNSYFFVYFGFSDDGTFSFEDGTFFTPQNSTITVIDDQKYYYEVFTQTCTSFIPAPTAPPQKYFPKCKTFKSQTIILNSTDAFDIYATSYMTWSLSENNLGGSGNSTIPGNYFFDYILNDDDELCTSIGCTFNLKSGDKKLIFIGSVDERIGFNLIENPIPMLGRIILRGNQTLMSEGIPFSTQNDCLFFNFPYSDDLVSTNKFCCSEFE